MVGEPIPNAQELTKSMEMMLKTVLAGGGYASKQMEILLGERLIGRGMQGPGAVQLACEPGLIDQHPTILTVSVDSNSWRQPRDEPSEYGAVILVVEPQASTRAVMRLALEGEGYHVLEAENGAMALKIMTQCAPRLVLQNLAIPDMRDFELVQWLKRLPGGSSVPTLAISESPALLEKARSRQAGFNGYLCRSYLPSHLLQTIYFFLPTRELNDGMPVHLRQPQTSIETTDARYVARRVVGHSMSQTRILVVESNDYQCRQLICHLSSQGFELSSVRDGWEALHEAQSGRPDVIICDPLASGLDGFALCLEVRKDPELSSIPVILSPLGIGMEIDAALARTVGAAGYVGRTPDYRALVKLLRETLRKKPVDVCVRSQNIWALAAC